jgi:hypothetical protein
VGGVVRSGGRGEEDDSAEGAHRDGARGGHLGHRTSEDRRLGRDAAEKGAAAGDRCDGNREQPPERAGIVAQGLTVGPAGRAGLQMAADRLVASAAVRLADERIARGPAREVGRVTVGSQAHPRPRDEATDGVRVDLQQGGNFVIGVTRELSHQQGDALGLWKLAETAEDGLELGGRCVARRCPVGQRAVGRDA